MDKYIGRLLDNRYEILEVIGTGGMAVVYKARCHRLNRLVAIKILKDDYLQDVEFRRRFHAESQAVAMLSHPNIVSVYDVSTSAEADYIVMELIDGITLKQYMEKKGVLNWKETLHFAIQIAKALEHAHGRGVVHRDIKPHNIMVLKNGSVKVADFGIARMMSKSNTLTKEALGSVHYISPEQAKGGRVDNRSDIYSLGVVMYEMMSGRPPYDGESPVAVAIQHINGGAVMPSTLNPNIPGGLEQIIMKAMAHDLGDRYPSATEMLRDMDEFRKDPAILFDYHTPPLDDVIRLKRPVDGTAGGTRTTAERVVERADGRRREMPAGGNRGNRQTAQAQRRREPEPRSSNAGIIAIVTCSLVAIIAGVIFLVVILNGGIFSKPKEVEVPKLIGKSYDMLPSYSGLEVVVQDERYDDTYGVGVIIDQRPEAGEWVDPGNTIRVIVSRGPEPDIITMENLRGMTEANARDFLGQYSLALQIKVLQEASDETPEGLVIRTSPEENAELVHGQTVTLWISSGPSTKTAKMPNVVGMSIDTALNVLKTAGFNIDKCSYDYAYSSKPKGEVIEQSIERNQDVDVNSAIVLVISDGPEPTEPIETSEPTEPPTEPLVTKRIAIQLPEDLVTSYVLSIRSGNVVVLERTMEPDAREIEVTLTGSGVQKFTMYVNGIADRELEVDFGADD